MESPVNSIVDLFYYSGNEEVFPPMLADCMQNPACTDSSVLPENTSFDIHTRTTVDGLKLFYNDIGDKPPRFTYDEPKDRVEKVGMYGEEFNQRLKSEERSSGKRNAYPLPTQLKTKTSINDKAETLPGSPESQRHQFQRKTKSRMDDAGMAKERRRRITKRTESEEHKSQQSKTGDVTKKRHSSGEVSLQERRFIEFGPVWLNGNGSIADLTPKSNEIAKSENPQSSTHLGIKKDINHNSRTTTTIGTLPLPEGKVDNYETRNTNSAVERSQSRTIAPLGSLDQQIQQRKDLFHRRSRTFPEKYSYNTSFREKADFARAESLPNPDEQVGEYLSSSDSWNSLNTELKEEERQGSLHTSVPNITKAITPDFIDFSKSASVADMKSALKRVRSKRVTGQHNHPNNTLKLTRKASGQDETIIHDSMRNRSDSSYSLQPIDELRARSGSLARLRRARSFFVKQPKVLDVNKNHEAAHTSREDQQKREISRKTPFQKQKSLNEHILYKKRNSLKQSDNEGNFFDEDSLHGVTDADVASLASVSSVSNVLMQGDLYRRKRLAWTKTWGVLTTDRLLTLYKTKKEFEISKQDAFAKNTSKSKRRQTFSGTTSLSGILSIINLAGGCEIENVEQGKKGTTFQLMPHSYHTFAFQGQAATLPIDAEWRRTHKPVHLMCKTNDEFLFWVKALVELNTDEKTGRSGRRRNVLLNSSDSPLSLRREHNLLTPAYSAVDSRHWTQEASCQPKTYKKLADRSISAPVLPGVMARNGDSLANFQDRNHPALGRRTSKGLDLDAIKYIDEEDEEVSVRVNKNRKQTKNSRSPEALQQSSPSHFSATVRDDVIPEEDRQRPLSSEKLEAKRREIQRLRRKLSGDPENRANKTKAGTLGVESRINKSTQRLPTPSDTYGPSTNRGLDRVNENSKSSTAAKYANSSSEVDLTSDAIAAALHHRQEKIDSETRVNKEPFERGGYMREKLKERKKKVTAIHANDQAQPVSSRSADNVVSSPNVREGHGHISSDNNRRDSEEQVIDNSEAAEYRKKTSDNIEDNVDSSLIKHSEVDDIKERDSAQARPNYPIEKLSLSRHQRGDSLKHLHHRFVGRKQKSLRQKVLRKLGQRATLSNSSPDITTDVDNEDLDFQDQQNSLDDSSGIKLKRHEAFRINRRPSSPAVLVRCRSEGSLSDESYSEDDIPDGGSMRTFQLNEDTFIDTYGVTPRKKKGRNSNVCKRHSSYEFTRNDFPEITLISDKNAVKSEKIANRQRLSASESSSNGSSSYEASLNSPEAVNERRKKQTSGKSKSDSTKDVVLRRPRSTGSDDGNTLTVKNKEARNSWISSLTPHFSRKISKDVPQKEAAKRNVFHTPASSLTSASHKGYLNRRNKRKQWDRFWCVLQDSCLYCYNSPQSASTQDAIVLRGYDVIADVTNLNRTKFPFRLERSLVLRPDQARLCLVTIDEDAFRKYQLVRNNFYMYYTGSPTLHLSSDNHREYILWVGTLEKETSMVQPASTDNEVLVNSIKNTIKPATVEGSVQNEDITSKSGPIHQPDTTPNSDKFQEQKEHLLREVLAETQKLIEEQRLLQEKHAEAQLPINSASTAARVSKDQINQKYTRVRDEEEMRTMKHLTLLNKRRNSAQLKVDQMTKELAPKSGRKRRENPQQFAEMEAKLKEMQDRLAVVDKEIAQRQAMRQDAMDKIQQRLELEMLILEQRDSIDIIKKHNARQKRLAFAQQTQPHDGNDRLPLIEEMSTISDCSSTSSSSFHDCTSLSADSRPHTMSPSPQKNTWTRSNHEETLSNGSSVADVRLSSGVSSMSTSTDDLVKPRKNSDDLTASKVDGQVRRKDEVDPSILADIEDFQRFSRKKLASLANQR